MNKWIVTVLMIAMSWSAFASDEHHGFQLSSEAIKNFDLKTVRLSRGLSWNVPLAAVVRTGEETNLYRLRDGYFSRIDFKLLRKTADQMVIASDDLKENDSIVISGIGFLRIAEMAALGGVADSRSH